MRISHITCLALAALFAGSCTGTPAPGAGGFSLTPEPLTGKFVWHDLITDDAARARQFYGGLFGWTFEETTRPNGGPYLLARHGSRYVAGLVELADPSDGGEYSRWLGYLSVADVDSAVRVVEAAGGGALRGPRQIGQIGRAAVIRDPEGAVLGLLRSERGDPDDSALGLVGRIAWNELLAHDDAAAAGFYAELAGYRVTAENRRGGTYYTLSDASHDRAGILNNPIDDTPATWLTYFRVADVADATRRAAELGAVVLLPPSPDLREGSMALLADPAGAILALTER